MGRMTRAKAAEVAGLLHIDEDALLELPSDDPQKPGQATPDSTHRQPLGEIAGNNGSTNDGRNKGKKNTRATAKDMIMAENSEENTGAVSDEYAAPAHADMVSGEVIPDTSERQPSSSEDAAGDLLNEVSKMVRDANATPASTDEMSQSPGHETKPTTPPSSAVRPTRSRLSSGSSVAELKARLLEQSGTQAERSASASSTPSRNRKSLASPVEPDTKATSTKSPPAEDRAPCTQDSMPSAVQNFHGSPTEVTTPNRSMNDSIASPATSETVYDQLETAVVEAITPPRSVSKPAQDAITALDELDDAVENVTSQVPDVQNSPQKHQPKKEKAAPTVRLTKASQARISLAHGPKDIPRAPAIGRPRQSLAVSQTDSKRINSSSSIKSNGSSTDAPVEKKEVVIPHSKPRPISMSFPTPPPPPKSTKAPTQSKFQLPGEAVAAKLKAAKEARLQRESEEQKKKVFKARPAPSMSSKPVVRQTSTSQVRQSLIGGAKPTPSATTTHRRATSLAISRPACRPSIASKPTSAADSVKKSSTPSSNKTITVPKRASTAMSVLNKSRLSTARPSTALSSKPNPPASAPNGAKSNSTGNGTAKGKEVFNRAANAKNSAEQQKREKEEAAKKARAEAAERSRALSREWAEKQKAKKAATASSS